jgi:hypothetical protein
MTNRSPRSQQFKSSLTFGNLFLAGAWALLLLCVYKYGEVSSDAPGAQTSSVTVRGLPCVHARPSG